MAAGCRPTGPGKPPGSGAVAVGPEVLTTPRPHIGPVAPESVLDHRADIRVDKNMVLIPVAVTTPVGSIRHGPR